MVIWLAWFTTLLVAVTCGRLRPKLPLSHCHTILPAASYLPRGVEVVGVDAVEHLVLALYDGDRQVVEPEGFLNEIAFGVVFALLLAVAVGEDGVRVGDALEEFDLVEDAGNGDEGHRYVAAGRVGDGDEVGQWLDVHCQGLVEAEVEDFSLDRPGDAEHLLQVDEVLRIHNAVAIAVRAIGGRFVACEYRS